MFNPFKKASDKALKNELQESTGNNRIKTTGKFISNYFDTSSTTNSSKMKLGNYYRDFDSYITDKQLPLALGFSYDKDSHSVTPIIEDLAKSPHFLIAGPPYCGKTTLFQNYMSSLFLCTDCEFILCSYMTLDFQDFQKSNRVIASSNIKSTHGVLSNLTYEMNQRLDVIRKANCSDFQNYIQSHGTNKLKPKVVVLDGLNLLLARNPFQKEIEHSILQISLLGRLSGVYLIATTTSPYADSLSTSIRSIFTMQLGFGCDDLSYSKSIIGRGGCEKLPRQGHFIIHANGKLTTGETCITLPDDDAKIVELASHYLISQ